MSYSHAQERVVLRAIELRGVLNTTGNRTIIHKFLIKSIQIIITTLLKCTIYI